ncbi:hypothetical protein AVEN_158165-1 [Araneus ventricosus]|uniref:Uncharacterized protein n=1 Tax=Araneus ventricosus TaxID=182803 RepID=A0A4Y2VAM2_ARAVE|nr:hypothetical protein AVEN_158165-1 [Araneus ventricosus]
MWRCIAFGYSTVSHLVAGVLHYLEVLLAILQVWKMFRISAGRLNSYNNDLPPSYDSATAADKESLPSYKEALERMLMQEAGNSSSSNSQSVLIDERYLSNNLNYK